MQACSDRRGWYHRQLLPYWSKTSLMSRRPSLKRGRRMVMLFTDRNIRCRCWDLARSRSAAATLSSRSFSARRRFMGSMHTETTIPIAATGRRRFSLPAHHTRKMNTTESGYSYFSFDRGEAYIIFSHSPWGNGNCVTHRHQLKRLRADRHD